MSLANCPEKTFAKVIIAIYKQTGIQCAESVPIWRCSCNLSMYNKLPNLNFDLLKDESLQSKTFSLPKEGYMMWSNKHGKESCALLVKPWKFSGLGAKTEEED